MQTQCARCGKRTNRFAEYCSKCKDEKRKGRGAHFPTKKESDQSTIAMRDAGIGGLHR